jgi:hypothetical protein
MSSLGWGSGGGAGVVEAVEGVRGGDVYYLHMLTIACLDVERLNRLNTYFSPAALLVLFGLWFVLGLIFNRWIPIPYRITLFSLHT